MELGVRDTNGAWIEIAENAGKPTLLFLFATFDTICQAAAQPLAFFAQRHPEVRVIAIAVQPGAEQLVSAWKETLASPFIVTYDPTRAVENGQSALGHVESVPSYVWIDATGVVAKRIAGYQTEKALDEQLRHIQ